ncbi:MAG: hypothetical protein LW807_04875 [Proteobacteria bacterium]|jgi:hypothetical protein|nr:hypothetical protein [Pseudomonadota bacterium]
MKKLLLILSLGFVSNIFAVDGYLGTVFSTVLTDGYGECVHTAYFEQRVDGIAECDEAQESAVASSKAN